MPPHDEYQGIPVTAYTNVYNPHDPLERPLNGTITYSTNIINMDSYVHWPTTSSVTIDANRITVAEDPLGYKMRIDLDRILDGYFRKIYRIIQQHVTIDISEDEFMKLLKEEGNE